MMNHIYVYYLDIHIIFVLWSCVYSHITLTVFGNQKTFQTFAIHVTNNWFLVHARGLWAGDICLKLSTSAYGRQTKRLSVQQYLRLTLSTDARVCGPSLEPTLQILPDQYLFAIFQECGFSLSLTDNMSIKGWECDSLLFGS